MPMQTGYLFYKTNSVLAMLTDQPQSAQTITKRIREELGFFTITWVTTTKYLKILEKENKAKSLKRGKFIYWQLANTEFKLGSELGQGVLGETIQTE